jgi:GNAT superfamily N-acetyltransferase
MSRVVDIASWPDRDRLLRAVYHQVLEGAFRPDELDPFDVTSAALAKARRTKDVLAVLGDGADDDVLAAAIGDWDSPSRVYLLSYLAARPGERGRGIGSTLMDHLSPLWRRRHALLTVAEVDDPRVYPVSNTGDPSARLRFYQRFGAGVLDLQYMQPVVRAGGQRVHGMLLLTFDIQPEALLGTQPRSIRSAVLLKFLSRYFAQAEGRTGEDAELAEFLGRISSQPGIRVLPIDHYTEIPVAPLFRVRAARRDEGPPRH